MHVHGITNVSPLLAPARVSPDSHWLCRTLSTTFQFLKTCVIRGIALFIKALVLVTQEYLAVVYLCNMFVKIHNCNVI